MLKDVIFESFQLNRDDSIKGQENLISTEEFLFKNVVLFFQRIIDRVHILSMDESLDLLYKSGKSIARFGDGEMNIIRGNSLDFQCKDRKLAKRLEQVLASNQNKCLIGITPAINKVSDLKPNAQRFWTENMYENRKWWVKHLKENVYCSANITRPYIDYMDREQSRRWFRKLRRIWNGKKILLVEGEGTRFGVGNKLLNNAEQIKRIICPAKNAFSVYEQILETVCRYDKEFVVLIALGPTATVLAYDLAQKGYQAIDIGHADLEFEWFRRKVKYKEKVKGKFTNEVKGGGLIEDCLDEMYQKQIDITIMNDV